MSSPPAKSLHNRRHTRSQAMLDCSPSVDAHSGDVTTTLLDEPSMARRDDFPTEFNSPSMRSMGQRLSAQSAGILTTRASLIGPGLLPLLGAMTHDNFRSLVKTHWSKITGSAGMLNVS